MKLRLLLWVLGRMMKRAARKNKEFRKLLSDTSTVYQIMTMDGNLVRHYVLGDGMVSTQPLVHANPDCIIHLRDDRYGFSVLTSKDKNAFLQGILQEDIVIDGSIVLLMKFQKLTGLLRSKNNPAPDESDTVGFVGTGLIGAPMARSLSRNGFRVLAYDTDPEALRNIARDGIIACSTVADMANAMTILIMVNTMGQVNMVVDQLCDVLPPDAGTSLLVMSTVSPDDMTGLRQDLDARGRSSIRLLDAPVSGLPLLADAGKLSIMAGGEKADFERLRPILSAMGDPEKIFFMGPLGSGSAMKLVNNSIGVSMALIVCESLELGVRNGLHADLMARVLNQSSGKNFLTEQWPLTKKLFQMILDDTTFNAKEGIFATGLKDLVTAHQWAEAGGMQLKSAESVISRIKELTDEDLVSILQQLVVEK